MLYAFLGTFMSTFVVGGLVYYAGTIGWCYPLGMLPSLVFGSLISATDPVTVLAVFQALRVKDDLFSMVFGESVLNDAVAIVLSRTLLMFIEVEVSASSIAAAGISFCKIFGGSVVIGGMFGALSSLVFKYLHMKEHHDILFLECALSFTFPWAAYYVAEGLELSGIVTILFCGIVMATYTRHNMSDHEPGVEKGKGGAVVLTARIYKCVALVAETYVFVYLGMAIVTFPIFEHTTVWLVIVAIGACFVGRLHIYVFSFIVNCFRGAESSPPPISGTYMHIMWFSGLRGGVAFALAAVSYAHGMKGHFPSQCLKSSTGEPYTTHTGCDGLPEYFSDSLAILQTTMIIAVFTIVVFGGSITSVCRAAGVIKPKGFVAIQEEATGEHRQMHNYLLKFLTRETVYEVQHGQRFGAAVDGGAVETVSGSKPSAPPVELRLEHSGMHLLATKSVRPQLDERGVEMVPEGSGVSSHDLGLEEKLDQMRLHLPGVSGADLKEMLDTAGGNVAAAISNAKERNGLFYRLKGRLFGSRRSQGNSSGTTRASANQDHI